MKAQSQSIKNGILAKGIVYNFLIAFVALILTWILGGPKINIEFKTALILSLILFIIFLTIILWILVAKLIFKRQIPDNPSDIRKDQNQILLRYCERDTLTQASLNSVKVFDWPIGAGHGPYKYIRHPICAVVIYLLNPGLAIVFRSWLYLLACVVIYFVWKSLAENEEALVAKELGESYGRYRLTANLLFPDLYSISRLLYFFFVGTAVFIAVFILLNFSSLAFRYIGWKADGGSPVTVSKNSEVDVNQGDGNVIEVGFPEASEAVYDKPNSIVIGKIGVDAPLIYAQSTDQKELDKNLNNGVVIYPGSDPPGQAGNFFLTGHSSVYPWSKTIYGRVFAALDKLEVGDTVVIYLQQHKYEYKITNKYAAASKDIRLTHPADETKITLMTCWPIGTSLKRLIVEGVLTNSH